MKDRAVESQDAVISEMEETSKKDAAKSPTSDEFSSVAKGNFSIIFDTSIDMCVYVQYALCYLQPLRYMNLT
mgnify:CR=1 FL=1